MIWDIQEALLLLSLMVAITVAAIFERIFFGYPKLFIELVPVVVALTVVTTTGAAFFETLFMLTSYQKHSVAHKSSPILLY